MFKLTANCAELGACACCPVPDSVSLSSCVVKTTYKSVVVFQKRLALWFALKTTIRTNCKDRGLSKAGVHDSKIEQDRVQHAQKPEHSVQSRSRKIQCIKSYSTRPTMLQSDNTSARGFFASTETILCGAPTALRIWYRTSIRPRKVRYPTRPRPL